MAVSVNERADGGARPDCCCSLPHLTRRQIDVLLEIAAGASSGKAAGALGLSRNTIETHIKAMLKTASVGRRSQLIALAAAQGIIDMTTRPPTWTGVSCLRQ